MTTLPSSLSQPKSAPGPVGLINGLRNLRAFQTDILGFLTRIAREHGDFTQFDFGPFRMYFANHPDLIHQVLVEDATKYHKTRLTKALLRPSLGEGLLISDGELWKRQRKLIQPAFHAARIAAYAETMTAYAERAIAEWQPGQTRSVDHDMMSLTLDIVIKTLFGEQLTPQERDDIGRAVDIGQKQVGQAFKTIFRAPSWLPTPARREGEWATQAINAVIARFIARYRQTGQDRGDLLSMMLAAVDEAGGMSDAQARDEAFTLIVAGHETTANTLTWAWYLLSQHPQAEAALHAELDAVLGGRAPAFDDLPRLPFTEAVVKETLRLYPAAYVTSREPQEDVRIGDYLVPKGSTVLISPYVTHHDTRWFNAPEQFKPERWLGDLEKRLPKFAYFPFGGGPRICIGNAFALMEARLILATIAQRFRLALAPGHRVTLDPLVTLRPKGGMRMVVQAR
ncbi:MAG: cytochrome P450 [Anaerolineae bacterium]|nr:cytochrome P450 [Candidatus Roseilinea sp.]MDW8451055.1 cytochrome P450 [Anaerolineae bacterium]